MAIKLATHNWRFDEHKNVNKLIKRAHLHLLKEHYKTPFHLNLSGSSWAKLSSAPLNR